MEPLALIPLCRATLHVSERIVLEDAPGGTLIVGELVDSVWEGDRFRLVQRGRAAADWFRILPDGTGLPDIRLTLENDAGEAVFVEYTGILNPETGFAYTTPRFTTASKSLAWLNRIQAVGRGRFDEAAMTVTYDEICELR